MSGEPIQPILFRPRSSFTPRRSIRRRPPRCCGAQPGERTPQEASTLTSISPLAESGWRAGFWMGFETVDRSATCSARASSGRSRARRARRRSDHCASSSDRPAPSASASSMVSRCNKLVRLRTRTHRLFRPPKGCPMRSMRWPMRSPHSPSIRSSRAIRKARSPRSKGSRTASSRRR